MKRTSAELAKWGYAPRTLRDILQKAGIESGEGGYDVEEAASAVIGHLRGELDKLGDDAVRDRARKAKAEADTAEMIAAQKRGHLVLKATLISECAEVGTRFRVKTMEAKDISEDAKKNLLKAVASDLRNSA